MKALSIRQPWCWAILHAGKRVENRDWKSCAFRGPLLIHASKGCGKTEYVDAADSIEAASGKRPPPLEDLERGGLVGMCRLVNAIDDDDSLFAVPGALHLQLADVVALPFVPFKGMLGFVEVRASDLGAELPAYLAARDAMLKAGAT